MESHNLLLSLTMLYYIAVKALFLSRFVIELPLIGKNKFE